MYYTDYNYKGIIGITHNMYKALKKCISDDMEKYFMNAVWVDKEKQRVLASDGRMIIIFDLPENINVETGYFIPFNINKKYFLCPYKIKGTYPNVDKVIPDYSCHSDEFTNKKYKKNDSIRNTIFIFRLFEEIKVSIDIERLSVLKYISPFNVKCGDVGKSVLFYNDDVKFIVMPIMPMENNY